MVMPNRERFRQALILSAGGAILVSGATAPATMDAKKPPNGGKETHASKVVHDKRPPNGRATDS